MDEPSAPSPASPSRALRDFFATEAAGGVLLLLATAAAMLWANSPWQASYTTLWHTTVELDLGRYQLQLDLQEVVNDGLMAIFFLVVALEVKRELLLGELRDRRTATLPVVAALGGMIVPALIYVALNPSGPELQGWGIPMATDIAFALGVLALVARGAPPGVRLFLLTLAIVDDIGAIVVIAAFYSDGIDWAWLAGAAAIVGVVILLRQLGVMGTGVFVGLGIALWIALHASGVHATLAGVIMGLLVPATPALTREIVYTRTDDLLDVFTPRTARETAQIARQAVSQLEWLEHVLHGWSSLVIVPIFALANAGITLSDSTVSAATRSTVTLGVLVGLVVGKAVGIGGASWLAIRTGIAELPDSVRWRQLVGAAALGGIGFTVSLFITSLAFDDVALVADAKIGVLTASVVASLVGALLLRSRPHPSGENARGAGRVSPPPPAPIV